MFTQKPRVKKSGKKAQLSYELPHRIHTSILYPTRSPNGSDIIIAGHGTGLSITWRGGHAFATGQNELDEEDQPMANGISGGHDLMSVDRDEEQGLEALIEDPDSDDEAEMFGDGDGEEEVDPDEPYPAVRQHINVPVGVQIQSIVAPDLPPPSILRSSTEVPELMKHSIVVVLNCSDRAVRLITLPLVPPTEASKQKNKLGIKTCTLNWGAAGQELLRGSAISWTSSPSLASDGDSATRRSGRSAKRTRDSPLDILVAISTSAQSGRLLFYRDPVQSYGGRGMFSSDNIEPFQTQYLPCLTTKIQFNTSHYPSKRHSQLLVADLKGCLRIYDPLAERISRQRPASRDSDRQAPGQVGAWLMTFTSSFRMPKGHSSSNPALASRKRIIDARWVSGGRAIAALLDDGEWGVWDVAGAGPNSQNRTVGTAPTDFAIHSFIGDTTPESTAIDARKQSLSRLAPMTPNTRRVRQENLFSSATTATGAASRGGISTSGNVSTSGTIDDSLVLWYGHEVYTVPSLNTFWQRSISSSGRDPGSLYSPGLSRVDNIDLFGETINSVHQFPVKSTQTSLGNIAQRDLVIGAEHRLIVITHTRPPTPSKALFMREPESPTSRQEKHLLDMGELDIGGVDRMLDGMMGVEQTNGFGKAKRVGFAH